MGKTIIVSNRLPISIHQEKEGLEFKPSTGGLATGLGSVFSKDAHVWIGWPGGAVEEPREKREISLALKGSNMVPVFLNNREIEGFYEGFCNETLWPAFHYFSQYISFNERQWKEYVRVNQKFCAAILEHAGPDDTIWIHDYHLLLLPKFIKEKLPHATIAFFLHIPFPSYEIFRMLPWREDILKGICGADLVGFHTHEDKQNFCIGVNRILGLENNSGNIWAGSHWVKVAAFPMGIDYKKFELSARKQETYDLVRQFKETLGQQKLLLSIDRLDYSKGILQRLKAFDLFLKQNPDQQEKLSLIMIVVPSRENVPEYKELKEEIDTLVGRINSKYSNFDWVPVHYFYRSFPFSELSAFYSMSDIALVTPLRDGMNLVCKEFVASKTEKKGVLILSEMAGASKELREAVLVNPFSVLEISQAIRTALSMTEEEQMEKMAAMQDKLRRNDVFRWVMDFMKGLDHVKRRKSRWRTKRIEEKWIELPQRSFQREKRTIVFRNEGSSFIGN